MILKNEFYTKSKEISRVEGAARAKQDQIVGNMKAVNQMNWQYLILQKGGKWTPINDYESIIVGQEFKAVKSNAYHTKRLPLVSINLVVNLYSSVI